MAASRRGTLAALSQLADGGNSVAAPAEERPRPAAGAGGRAAVASATARAAPCEEEEKARIVAEVRVDMYIYTCVLYASVPEHACLRICCVYSHGPL